MDIYLVDGTYELFRHYYVIPSHLNKQKEEVAATRGVVASIIGMLESGIRHIGVATDHLIHSFRNDMWHGYKTDKDVPSNLLTQFPLLETALQALGVVVWPMMELEADDAIAAAALSLGKSGHVERVVICSPDKDFAQCVRGDQIVQLDRRKKIFRNETGVIARFGVPPSSIPDWLALVGDVADGYPGIHGWGEKSASMILGKYGHLENIPKDVKNWEVWPRHSVNLSNTLQEDMKLALLFRDLATLRTNEPKIKSPNELHWKSPSGEFEKVCKRLDALALAKRAHKL